MCAGQHGQLQVAGLSCCAFIRTFDVVSVCGLLPLRNLREVVVSRSITSIPSFIDVQLECCWLLLCPSPVQCRLFVAFRCLAPIICWSKLVATKHSSGFALVPFGSPITSFCCSVGFKRHCVDFVAIKHFEDALSKRLFAWCVPPIIHVPS